MAKTALRRHHTQRLKHLRKNYWGRRFSFVEPLDEKGLNIVARTPKPCNCWMCKNPRKVFGSKAKLAKERREEEFANSQELVPEAVLHNEDALDNELDYLSEQ